GNIFNGTVNGAQALTVNDSGTTTFNFAVGNTRARTNMTTDGGWTSEVSAAALTTTAAQTYGDNVTLGAATILTGVGNTFNGTVKIGRASWRDRRETTRVDVAVGNTTALTSLTTNAGGTTVINGRASTTTTEETH